MTTKRKPIAGEMEHMESITPVKPVYIANYNSDLWNIVENKISGIDTDAYKFDKYEIVGYILQMIEIQKDYEIMTPEDFKELFDILKESEDFSKTIDKIWKITFKNRVHPYHESVYQIMNMISEMLFIFNDNRDLYEWDMLSLSRVSALCAIMSRISHHNVSYDTGINAEQSTINLWRCTSRYYMEVNPFTPEDKKNRILILKIAYREIKRLMDIAPEGETKSIHMEGFEWLEDSVTTRREDGSFEEDD